LIILHNFLCIFGMKICN